MSDIASAVGNVELIDGGCNAEEALYQCGSALFTDDAAGRSRVLIVLLGGKSEGNIQNAAGALKTAGVKIITIGLGSSVDNSQLSAIATSPSSVQSVASHGGLAGITESVSKLVSQGI